MVAGSILPVCIYKNKLYFLFGEENKFEDSSPGWADFGGGCDANETPYQTALREGSEELTGFLGSPSDLKKYDTLNFTHNDYHVFMIHVPYNETLVDCYNKNHDFLWKRMNNKLLAKSKFFEKQQIQWFSIDEMIKHKKKFRHFYKEIVDILYQQQNQIRDWLK